MSHTLDNQTRFNGAVSSEIPGVKPQDTMLDRWLAVSFTIIPLLGFIIAMVLLWKDGIGVLEVGTLVGMYTVNGIGISVGFHRLFAHCAFETNKAIQVILAIAGSTAGQNSLLRWVASHRCHHQHSDHPGDPHSPLLHSERIFDRLRGLWHAHAGWVLVPERASVRRYAPDLLQDTLIVKVSRLYLVWVVVGLAIPALVGGLLMWTWMGALRGLLWGGFRQAVSVLQRHGECQLDLSRLWHSPLPLRWWEPEQYHRCSDGFRGRVAQQPPRIPIFGKVRTEMVAD